MHGIAKIFWSECVGLLCLHIKKKKVSLVIAGRAGKWCELICTGCQ